MMPTKTIVVVHYKMTYMLQSHFFSIDHKSKLIVGVTSSGMFSYLRYTLMITSSFHLHGNQTMKKKHKSKVIHDGKIRRDLDRKVLVTFSKQIRLIYHVNNDRSMVEFLCLVLIFIGKSIMEDLYM